jgi:hypothetical protein
MTTRKEGKRDISGREKEDKIENILSKKKRESN